MWDRIDQLLERAPNVEALRLHRVELLEARRRRLNGLDTGPFVGDETAALVRDLALMPLLTRVRAAWDGPLVLHKGAEVALDYPGPRLRRFCDLDVLTNDAPSAQAALLAAGFRKVRQEESRGVVHHLCPLEWPGLPLSIELHTGPNWVDRLSPPAAGELLATAVPSRLGVNGVGALAPAAHALVLAAHAWSHDELGRLGNLIDVAVTLQRADEAEVAALARRWGCSRLWRTTRKAVDDVLEGTSRSLAVSLWAGHLRDVRERTVVEWHAKRTLAPVWGLPRRRIPGAVVAETFAKATPGELETWPTKVRRARLASRNAGVARSEHLLALDAHSSKSIQGREAG